MNYNQGDEIMEGEMRGICSTHGGDSKYAYIFVRLFEGKIDNTAKHRHGLEE
jgi:hypothetical protein